MILVRRAVPFALAAALAGCGGSLTQRPPTAGQAPSPVPPSASATAPPSAGRSAPAPAPVPPPARAGAAMSELLSVPAVGRIYGTCAPGARRWTVEFVAAPTTSERFTYRISGSPRLTFKLSPGQVVTLQLVPGAAKRHEPADPVSGYGPSTVPIATPVKLTVEQGSEPRVYRVDVNLGVAAAIGDTSDCALISSTVRASTYYPGGPPPA